MAPDLDLSVIIPVYNTMPELKACMDSLLEQDIGNYRYEIVAVNDGSTDGGGELLDEYAGRHSNVRVIHQENSGWPGLPRNVAIAASSGRYVFFMDADDQLGRESLRRQVKFADQHSSDIVIPKIVSTVDAVGAVWKSSAIDADRALIFKTLSPQKLFRRSFLDEHDIRFPEGVVPLEDGILLARAYFLAQRVSILADYDYYYKHARAQEGDSGSISLRPKPPEPFIDSVTKIIDIVREHADDADLTDRIVLDIYRRKALKRLLPDRFAHYKSWRQEALIKAVGELARSRISPELEARLPFEARLRSMAARAGDTAAAVSLAEDVNAGGVAARVEGNRVLANLPEAIGGDGVDVTDELEVTSRLRSARSTEEGFSVEVDVTAQPVALVDTTAELVISRRGGGSENIVVPATWTSGGTVGAASSNRMTAEIPTPDLDGAPSARWDVSVRLAIDGAFLPIAPARVGVEPKADPLSPTRDTSAPPRHVEPYVTAKGNLSFRAGSRPSVPPLVRSRDWVKLRRRQLVRKAARSARVHSLVAKVPGRRAQTLGTRLDRARRNSPQPQRSRTNSRTRAYELARACFRRFGFDLQRVSPKAVTLTSRGADTHQLGRGAALVREPEIARKYIYDIHKALYKRMTVEHVVSNLHAYRVNCVLDVGANKGQYARELRSAGYQGHIISFEPVPETFQTLEHRAADDPRWTVYQWALGRENATVPMNVDPGTLSSLLPSSDYGNRRFKRLRDTTTVDVPLRRLADVLDEIIPADISSPRLYLKLDTQGYDMEAFAGLDERVNDVVGMQSEMALLQIYEGMPRLPQVVETYEAAGFEVTGMFPVTREKETGRVLEFDCVLARADTR